MCCDPETHNGLLPRGHKRPSLHAPLGIMAFGHQCTLPRLRRQCSPLRNLCIRTPMGPSPGTVASRPHSTSQRPRCLGPNPCPLTCGRPLPGGGAPGPSLGGLATAALPSDAGELHHPARAQRREGKGGSARGCWAQPHFPPLLPRRAGGGVSSHAQSRPAGAAAEELEWKEWVGTPGQRVGEQAQS